MFLEISAVNDSESSTSIDFTMTESLKDTWGYENKFIKFKSTLKRKDFNLNWNKTLAGEKYLVGDVITFWGSFQIQPANHKTPSTNHMIPDTEYIRLREKEARGEVKILDTPSQSPLVDPPKVGLKPAVTLPRNERELSLPKEESVRKTFVWWVSLSVLGLLGFFSVIIISFYSKNILSEYFPRNYKENGILGFASDMVVILVVIIYSVAFWLVGWGEL